ncbi:lipopolysaccharide-induced tumor necrosis factor-alpha factor homolog [Schistocerca americana]|uniref:lipopolysaccharide-induced tumor necrosis factor-alpha factor homolog n=1 Tax=Schistocerca americana TaxID=7009 RepID=UPI001F4FA5A5|nr:lipopolysaccharide-induced tumor necrosis factor-alpha factor homolog [Schistocerca americana]
MGKSEDSMPQPASTDTTTTGYDAAGDPVRKPYSEAPTGNATAEDPLIPGGGMKVPLTLGPESCTVVCPACYQTIQTDVEVKTTSETNVLPILCDLISCCCCCCMLFLWFESDHHDHSVDSCCCPDCECSYKDTHEVRQHYCPSCKAFIGAYEK